MPRDPLIGTTLAGRYRIEEQVGRGGMSTVYRAYDITLERPVAIKAMHRDLSRDESFLERFRREGRSVAQLSHPHVVTLIDAGDDEGHPYIVFEYVPGETLKKRIRRAGPLPVSDAVAYAIEIGRGLSAAHAKGLVHRDVKPQNVLLDEEGRAKITDFGIARSHEAEALTQTGRVLGTTDYVSPEQALGHRVTGQSDVYSLGIVLFEMLTGSVPFPGTNHVEVAMKHVRVGLPDVQARRPEASAALAAIVERATAKSTTDRYASASAMVADLEEVLGWEIARSGQETGEATTVLRSLPRRRAGRRPAKSPTRSRALVPVALAAAAAAIAALVVLTRPFGDKPDGPARQGEALNPITLPAGAASDYDPPPGDRSEHPGKVQTVVDGNPQTFWDTEAYKLPDLGGKRGVGLRIDAGEPVRAKALVLRSPQRLSGYDASIYGANPPLPQSAPRDWTLLARKAAVATRERLILQTGDRGFRHYLIWITRLSGTGPYQAGIAEAKLLT